VNEHLKRRDELVFREIITKRYQGIGLEPTNDEAGTTQWALKPRLNLSCWEQTYGINVEGELKSMVLFYLSILRQEGSSFVYVSFGRTRNPDMIGSPANVSSCSHFPVRPARYGLSSMVI
jgi:hypothetical protein